MGGWVSAHIGIAGRTRVGRAGLQLSGVHRSSIEPNISEGRIIRSRQYLQTIQIGKLVAHSSYIARLTIIQIGLRSSLGEHRSHVSLEDRLRASRHSIPWRGLQLAVANTCSATAPRVTLWACANPVASPPHQALSRQALSRQHRASR